MLRILLTACAVTIALAVGSSYASDSVQDYFKECKDGELASEELRASYSSFVETLKKGDESLIQAACLPYCIDVTTSPRAEKSREYGRDLNLPFLRSGFAPQVLAAAKHGDDCLMLRTKTTSIGFVQVKSGAWKIYRWVDKPIE